MIRIFASYQELETIGFGDDRFSGWIVPGLCSKLIDHNHLQFGDTLELFVIGDKRIAAGANG